MLSGWLAVVVAWANRHTVNPDRPTTFECSEADVQPVLLLADGLALGLLLLEQAATTSPMIAAITAGMVSLPIVLTRSPPF